MRLVMGSKRALIALALFGVVSLCAAASAKTPELRAFKVTYDAIARGVNAGQVSFDFEVDGSTYTARSRRRMIGVAHLLFGESQDFSYFATGDVSATGVVRPSAYRHQGGRNKRSVHATFTENDIITIANPPMGMGRPPATTAQKQGAVDQVSMMLQLLLSRGDPCSQTVRVYMDGRSRFDLEMRPNGQERVALRSFRGAALRCRVEFRPIAGFSDPTPSATLEFLFAPLANGMFMPLQIEMPTEAAGTVTLRASQFEVR